MREWEILTTQKGRRTFELRLRNPWINEPSEAPRQKWILASCDQEFDESGTLISVMGCITDISAQKHAEAAAVERANLVDVLARRTQEANEHEQNFRRMAEISPCGLATFSIDGRVTWANSQWYEMTGHSRNPHEHCSMSFLHSIDQKDHDAFRMDWEKLTVGKEEVSSELRLVKPWIRQESNQAIWE